MHGCSQNAQTIAVESGWNTLADRYHFVVLYPEQNRWNNMSNCFNWFNQKDIDPKKGELASIKNMIDYTINNYNIDTSSIFSYGVSAGAMMSVSLLAEFPALFNGGAIMAGGPYKVASNVFQGMGVLINPPDKEPEKWKSKLPHPDKKAPKLLVYHGKKDNVVDIQNAYELIEQWCAWMSIDPSQVIKHENFEDHNGITKHAYNDEKNNCKIVFFELDNIGHALAVDPGTEVKKGGKIGAFSKDIDFFSTFYVAKYFQLF